ncbi:MAG: DUF2061 domain-containing protein [Novosphingobium sp.]|nr:DUF2061 domain-containing protein [Novosphingobium sp.]MCP5402872.1 DUF2061 domain-containing protein [Novosphingobium sp.]
MFLFKGHETHSRSFVKATSWRVLGSVDTFLLSWLFTGNPAAAGAIATTEVITKMALYYGHERIWASIHWGFKEHPEEAQTVEQGKDQ